MVEINIHIHVLINILTFLDNLNGFFNELFIEKLQR